MDLVGILSHWVAGPLVQVQKGQWNKNGTKTAEQKLAEQKLVGTLGHWVGDHSASAKRSAEQKWNKNSGIKIGVDLGHWVMGTLSASAKRSAEQKCGTKRVEQKLVGTGHWTLQVQKGQWNKNAEQKERNKNCKKIGGDHWTLGNGDPKYKCKKVSGTKMQNKNSAE